MKILLVTSVYENEVVGPARFARLLESSPSIDVDILTSNVVETKSLKSVHIQYTWWQQKLKIYFSRSAFAKKINALRSAYDVLLFNSSILADPKSIAKPYIVMVNDEKLANLKFSFRFDFIRRLLHRSIEKRAVQNASKVVVNSNYLKYRIADLYKIKSEKIYVLYKGISVKNKQKQFNDTLDQSKVIKIIFVKNDYIIGGLPDLVQVLGKLKEFTFNLTIIGTSEKVRHVLKPYDNISYRVLGYKSNDEVIEAMYQNDLLCIPSRFEPLGVAIMEGLAVGIPTITTGVGGLPELTNNGVYVWECIPKDVESLANQIKSCISNPELRLIKSKNGRRAIHQTFDIESVVKRLKSIVES